MLAELKQCFLEAYDDNRDGKIDIREVMDTFWIHLHLLQKVSLYIGFWAITFIHSKDWQKRTYTVCVVLAFVRRIAEKSFCISYFRLSTLLCNTLGIILLNF